MPFCQETQDGELRDRIHDIHEFLKVGSRSAPGKQTEAKDERKLRTLLSSSSARLRVSASASSVAARQLRMAAASISILGGCQTTCRINRPSWTAAGGGYKYRQGRGGRKGNRRQECYRNPKLSRGCDLCGGKLKKIWATICDGPISPKHCAGPQAFVIVGNHTKWRGTESSLCQGYWLLTASGSL